MRSDEPYFSKKFFYWVLAPSWYQFDLVWYEENVQFSGNFALSIHMELTPIKTTHYEANPCWNLVWEKCWIHKKVYFQRTSNRKQVVFQGFYWNKDKLSIFLRWMNTRKLMNRNLLNSFLPLLFIGKHLYWWSTTWFLFFFIYSWLIGNKIINIKLESETTFLSYLITKLNFRAC